VKGRPVVVALHGFTRGPQSLARLAAACNEAGFGCVRPSFAPRWLPVLYMDKHHLRRVARRLAARIEGDPIVVAGHSAGAAAGCYLAVELLRLGRDVRGVVLIDGVDSPTHLIASMLPHLRDVRLAAVLAPPSPCNRQGALERHLEDCPGVRVRVIEGAGHGDVEGAGIAVYRRACGDASDEATAARFLGAVVEAIEWAAGDILGRPGDGGLRQA
jgi:pimeloyl-ACP methyl ester carboxylesterase